MSITGLYKEWLSATEGELHEELLSMTDKQKEEAFCKNIEFLLDNWGKCVYNILA